MADKYLFLYLTENEDHALVSNQISGYLKCFSYDNYESKYLHSFYEVKCIVNYFFNDYFPLSKKNATKLLGFLEGIKKNLMIWRIYEFIFCSLSKNWIRQEILVHRPDKVIILHSLFDRPVKELQREFDFSVPVEFSLN